MFCAALNEKFNLGSQRGPIKNDSGALAALSKRLSTFVSGAHGAHGAACFQPPTETRAQSGKLSARVRI